MAGNAAIEAVGQLFGILYSPLVRYATRQTDSLETAEDIVQEAFLSLFHNLAEGRDIGNPKAWLLCVVRREAIKCYREVRRHGGAFLPLPEELEAPLWMPASDGDELTSLMAALSRREEEVVLLRAKGLKYHEIAGALGITVGSVKTLMARSLRKMQAARLLQAESRKEGCTTHGQAIR